MLSLLGIPGLLSASVPSQALAQQWEGIYTRGKALGPRVALISLVGYGYLAYERRSRGEPWLGYVAGAALSIGIVPFTLICMSSTNGKLLAVASGAAKTVSETTVRELAMKWKGLNLMRSVFPLAGAIIGFWSLVG